MQLLEDMIIAELQAATAYAAAYVDSYNQQEQDGEVLVIPAIFVETAPQIDWRDLTYSHQEAHTFFTVHLITDAPTTGIDRVANTTQDNHYNLYRAICKALHRKFVQGPDLTIEHIHRRSTLTDRSFELLHITRIVFDCRLFDTMLATALTEVPGVQPDIATTQVAFIADIVTP